MTQAIVYFVVLMSAICLNACSGPSERPFNKEQMAQVNSMIDSIRPQAAKCDLLAKCMGYKEGNVRALDSSMLYRMMDYEGRPQMNIRFEVSCFMVKPSGQIKQVTMVELEPMLSGCQSKSCGKECDAKTN